jgi:hypothetical protein
MALRTLWEAAMKARITMTIEVDLEPHAGKGADFCACEDPDSCTCTPAERARADLEYILQDPSCDYLFTDAFWNAKWGDAEVGP